MSGNKSGFSAYIGCVGKDAFGKELKDAVLRDGVTPYYLEVEDAPTGTCAVLIKDTERSLVANLSAAEKYSKTHFESAEVQEVVRNATIVYSAGFFLTHSAETMVAAGKSVAESNGARMYAMNLSAPFLCQFFKDQMHSVLPYCDFVFGNESEAAAYAENNGFAGAAPEEIALRIAALPKASGARPRIVIITQGSQPTVVAENGKVTTVPVPLIPAEKIVDTNGAGDAFVGGFLAYFANGNSIVDSVHAGHWSAGHILQKSGCVFDHRSSYGTKVAPASPAKN
jgi:adenosine kinase